MAYRRFYRNEQPQSRNDLSISEVIQGNLITANAIHRSFIDFNIAMEAVGRPINIVLKTRFSTYYKVNHALGNKLCGQGNHRPICPSHQSRTSLRPYFQPSPTSIAEPEQARFRPPSSSKNRRVLPRLTSPSPDPRVGTRNLRRLDPYPSGSPSRDHHSPQRRLDPKRRDHAASHPPPSELFFHHRTSVVPDLNCPPDHVCTEPEPRRRTSSEPVQTGPTPYFMDSSPLQSLRPSLVSRIR